LGPHPFLLLTLRARFLYQRTVYQPQNHAVTLSCPFFYTTLVVVIAAMQQAILPLELPACCTHCKLRAGSVVSCPCLPELIWHRHLQLRSVSRRLASRPQLLGVSAKGENTCSHVTVWSPWRDNVKHDSLRESRKVSHRDSTKWARAFQRRKVIHTQHLSGFNVKGRR
jgi:hypothetical protein